MRYVFALAGNQNSGKTTLFNQLTGANQHVGNWPGVTVEQKTGVLIRYQQTGDRSGLFGRRKQRQDNTNEAIQIVDLPGIYSLSPYTIEEVVTRDFITKQKPDLVINIVDATNLERNLYLTLQLTELETPLIVALNMMDEVKKRGDRIDMERLSRALGVPFVPISARSGEGLDALVGQAMAIAMAGKRPQPPDLGGEAFREAMEAILRLTEKNARDKGLAPRYAGTKIVEGDRRIEDALRLDAQTLKQVGGVIARLEGRQQMERAAIVADARYAYLEGVMRQCVVRSWAATAYTGNPIDWLLMNRALAFPAFFLMMFLLFAITFGPVGSFLADGFSAFVDQGIEAAAMLLQSSPCVPWVRELIVDGILKGIGSVLSFLPTLMLLFLLLGVLEDSGYMARAAFLMDQPMRRLGLSGHSFIPLLMGFGCTVPAVMGARNMQSQRDRRFTILLTPLMSCGAKVPIYAIFTRAFFPEHGVAVMLCLYLCGMLMAVVSASVLKRSVFRGEAAPFLMELPAYRLPTLGNIGRQLWERAKDFLQRAFTVILAAAVLIWLMQRFTFSLTEANRLEESILGVVGGWCAPLLSPLGFGTAAAATALLTGIIAKESVVSTLSILSGAEAGSGDMLAALRGIFPSSLSAASFLTFVLLYSPCVAALAAMRREMEGRFMALASAVVQTAAAWCAAFIVYAVGGVFV